MYDISSFTLLPTIVLSKVNVIQLIMNEVIQSHYSIAHTHISVITRQIQFLAHFSTGQRFPTAYTCINSLHE